LSLPDPKVRTAISSELSVFPLSIFFSPFIFLPHFIFVISSNDFSDGRRSLRGGRRRFFVE
jgi:hypothetical protein